MVTHAELKDAVEQQSHETLLGLIEAVSAVNQATKVSNHSVAEAAASIIAAPEKLANAVNEGFQGAVGELEKERRLLEQTRRVLRIEQQRYLVGFFAFLLLVLVISGVVLFLFLQPKIDEYKAYRDSHEVLEAGSVYGARIVDSDNGSFVLFDEGVAVGGFCQDLPNCIAIKD